MRTYHHDLHVYLFRDLPTKLQYIHSKQPHSNNSHPNYVLMIPTRSVAEAHGEVLPKTGQQPRTFSSVFTDVCCSKVVQVGSTVDQMIILPLSRSYNILVIIMMMMMMCCRVVLCIHYYYYCVISSSWCRAMYVVVEKGSDLHKSRSSLKVVLAQGGKISFTMRPKWLRFDLKSNPRRPKT